ncbi:MAG: 4Fe-4S dicluster domain-containing protein [Deltaproteobacteria bacterium]|nr:4Fe-4S dicluster domain-containing protein [Deltaproteobacteria bacterium]
MKLKLSGREINSASMEHLERVSGEDAKKCYQCGNCSAGCPVSYEMDMNPSEIIRFLQFGKIDDAMAANSMWVCVGCLQCYSRCPKGVSAASILEGLRQLTLRKGQDHDEVKDLPVEFIKKAPQQAIVSGFRKFVS